MRGLRQCGWLAAGLSLLLLGAAPASAKDVYTLALPTYLKGFWHVSLLDSHATEQSKGHLEFEQDPADRDAMIADYCEKPGESSRRRIREPEDGAAPPKQCTEGYLLVGRVRVKLTSPTAGLVEFKPEGADSSDEMFEFKFDPNLNMLHTAQGAVSDTAQELGFSAFQATVVAANHLQLTGFGMDGDAPTMTTLSAKKGVANKDQETFISKWGPSALVFVFFIGSKFLRKKYGKGSDYMKERQSMPRPRTMPPAQQKSAGNKKAD